MYMISTRVIHDAEKLKKIIDAVPRFDGRKMTLSDAARYAVQKEIDRIENDSSVRRSAPRSKKVVQDKEDDL